MNRNKLVLVTGGCGFIGRNLIPLLLKQNYSVRVLDNMSVASSDDIAEYNVEIIKGDIRNENIVRQATEGAFAVVHLAAQTNVINSQKVPKDDCEINVLGTLNLLMAARDFGVKRFIFASSNAPIGENEPPIDENKPARPLSPYGASKLAGEGYCSAFYGSYGLGTIILRFANVYGPRSGHKGSVVAKFLKDSSNHGSITIFGDGKQTRDFIHVRDLCQAIEFSIRSQVSGEVFQIATGIETSVETLAETLASMLPEKPVINYVPARAGEIVKNYSQITKAKTFLGWEPFIDLRKGLSETTSWYLSSIDCVVK